MRGAGRERMGSACLREEHGLVFHIFFPWFFPYFFSGCFSRDFSIFPPPPLLRSSRHIYIYSPVRNVWPLCTYSKSVRDLFLLVFSSPSSFPQKIPPPHPDPHPDPHPQSVACRCNCIAIASASAQIGYSYYPSPPHCFPVGFVSQALVRPDPLQSNTARFPLGTVIYQRSLYILHTSVASLIVPSSLTAPTLRRPIASHRLPHAQFCTSYMHYRVPYGPPAASSHSRPPRHQQ